MLVYTERSPADSHTPARQNVAIRSMTAPPSVYRPAVFFRHLYFPQVKKFTARYKSLLILPFDILWSGLLTASLNKQETSIEDVCLVML